MSDEVIPGLEELGHERCVRLEVHPVDRRIRRQARPLDRDQLEPLGEGLLNAPRHSRRHRHCREQGRAAPRCNPMTGYEVG